MIYQISQLKEDFKSELKAQLFEQMNILFNYLIENREGFLKNRFPGVDNDTIKLAMDSDPTPTKKHSEWIIRQHLGKDIPRQHLGAGNKIHQVLTDFERFKGKSGVDSNIQSYKSINDVDSAVSAHAKLIHNDPELGVKAYDIKTKEASCSMGKGTSWCTANKKKTDFEDYKRDGKLIQIEHKNRKYLAHVSNNESEFADEKNHHFGFNDKRIHPDILKSLAKSNHPEINKINAAFGNPHKEPDKSLITSNLDDVRRGIAEHYPHLAHHFINDPNWAVRLRVAYHSEHAQKLANDPNELVRKAASETLSKLK